MINPYTLYLALAASMSCDWNCMSRGWNFEGAASKLETSLEVRGTKTLELVPNLFIYFLFSTWVKPYCFLLIVGWLIHNNYVTMSTLASQITSLTIVYSSVYSGPNQRKHQSSASFDFVMGIHRWPMNSPHKGPVTRKMIHIWWHYHVLDVPDTWSYSFNRYLVTNVVDVASTVYLEVIIVSYHVTRMSAHRICYDFIFMLLIQIVRSNINLHFLFIINPITY